MSEFRIPQKGDVWRHTSTGKDYLILGVALNAVTETMEIVYVPQEDGGGWLFTREIGNFLGRTTEVKGGRIPRFSYVRGVRQ